MADLCSPPRLLFVSYHCPFDSASGAALCVRDLLVLLAERGWPCAVCAGPLLDFVGVLPLGQALDQQQIPYRAENGQSGGLAYTVYRCAPDGVPSLLFAPEGARPYQAPTPAEGQMFLAWLQRVLTEFRPDVVLTYGGFWLAEKIMAAAKGQGAAVVFALYNFAYSDAALFRQVDAVLVPSRCSAAHYRDTLGLECTVLPGPLDWRRLLCPEVERKYVTFVNPRPEKGSMLFARIAYELGWRRPDIPLLAVEGRGRSKVLDRSGLDLAWAGNLFVMANTPDPRDFYGVSRLLLMPSLWRESFGRVAAEALLNGIPVLASNRGALSEVLEQAGFLFDIPARYTPESEQVPGPDEAAPWIETIVRLYDDGDYYEAESRRCRAAAAAWRPERLLPGFEEFFRRWQA